MSTEQRADAPVLVTGATGLHGSAVTRALLAANRRVRAFTRDPAGPRGHWLSELGAEVITGDLLDTESLTSAMQGTAAVYAVTTPFSVGPEGEIEQGEHIIAAAREAQLTWLILASVASADRSTGIPHFDSKARIEQQLRASHIPHIIVAPTYFYENLGDPAEIVAGGELELPLSPSRPLQQVAVADLGALVVALLGRREEFLSQRVEVAGDQPTPAQMAADLSTASGQSVRHRQTNLEEVAGRNSDIAAMYRYLEQTGYQVDIPALHGRFPEVAWTSFADWARQRTGAR
jgi:uncharacterized protein YbjT (DUF2867 family)